MRELQAVRVGMVDFTRRRITVLGKNGVADPVFFPPPVSDLLRALAGDRDRLVYLFASPHRQAGPRRVEWVEDTLRRLGREAGLSYPLTAHLLRHACARFWKQRTGNLAVVQKIMRHASIQITVDLYGPLDADDVQAVYDQILGLDRQAGP